MKLIDYYNGFRFLIYICTDIQRMLREPSESTRFRVGLYRLTTILTYLPALRRDRTALPVLFDHHLFTVLSTRILP